MPISPANLADCHEAGEDVGMASLYRRGRVWWYAFVAYDDQRIARSARTGSRAVAKAIMEAEQHRHSLVRLGLVTPEQLEEATRRNTDPSELLPAWVAASNGDEGYRATRRAWVSEFLESQRVRSCGAFGTADLAQSVRRWDAAHASLSSTTRNARLSALRAFAAWLVAGNYTQRSLVGTVALVPAGARRIEHAALTPAECARLFAVPGRGLLYRFCVCTGLRGDEAARVLRSDLELGDRPLLRVRPETAKNKLGCTVPLLASLADALVAGVGMRHPSLPIFESLGEDYERSAVVARDLAGCGIKGANWRSFRRTFCTALEVAGVAEDARAKLRRDKGRGSTTLVRWTYSDAAQTTDPLRPEIAKLDRWLAGAFEGTKARTGIA